MYGALLYAAYKTLKGLWDDRENVKDDVVYLTELAFKTIKKVVNKVISRGNLKQIVTETINEQNDEELRKKLGEQIQVYVNSKKGNVISVDVLESITQKPVVQVELTGTSVADDVYAGLKI